ncbi:hypothetical protein [Paraburkholderia bannensis]|uniref:hypothetical protein n=1 Tax=Paraburkholderia bannensis TaxID=765414 RepID=UPI002AB6C408|nr:hypothetical protein [Paraburkholderia bannensis]
MKLKTTFATLLYSLFLSACGHEHGSVFLDKLESSGAYQVKVFFHSQEKGLDIEKNYFSCVSGDGIPARFYQDRQSGIWTLGKIESLGHEANNYQYAADMNVYYYDRKSNSFGNSDKNKILSTLKKSDFLMCRVVLRNYYRAPDLSNEIKISGRDFLRYVQQ